MSDHTVPLAWDEDLLRILSSEYDRMPTGEGLACAVRDVMTAIAVLGLVSVDIGSVERVVEASLAKTAALVKCYEEGLLAASKKKMN